MMDETTWSVFMGQFGELRGDVKGLARNIEDLNNKADTTLQFQAQADERFKAGNVKFQQIDAHLENTDENIGVQTKRIDVLEDAPATRIYVYLKYAGEIAAVIIAAIILKHLIP